MSELFSAIWGDFVYRTFAVVICGELLIFGFFMGWLLMQLRNKTRREEYTKSFRRHFSKGFESRDATERDLNEWAEKIRDYPSDIVREFLVNRLQGADSEQRPPLLELYRELGFADQDRQGVRARALPSRLAALRRMVVTATEEDREVLLESNDDQHLVRILKARIFARIGEPSDIVAVLEDIELDSRLLEDPIYAMLLELSSEDLAGIFESWESFESPRMKRTLLNVAADAHLESAIPRLEQAAEADDMELRIGACEPAAEFEDDRTLDILFNLLEDGVWQVRARAAAALGQRRDERALERLADAMEDPQFWVRQNAASALRAFGANGRTHLERIADQSSDPFARDTAAQELGRMQLGAERRASA